jgi:hypothetical protein
VARCEALFVSGLQRSDALTAAAVVEAISRTVRQFVIGGCVTLSTTEQRGVASRWTRGS